jgi:CDP-diacylglycerol pyrophosphatase
LRSIHAAHVSLRAVANEFVVKRTSMHQLNRSRLGKTLLAFAVATTAFSAMGRGTLHTPGQKSPDLPPNSGPDAYRQIVQNQCVVNWTQHNNPTPCEKVFLADANAESIGYALLADPDGGAHYLLIPTQTMTGADSGELLDPNLPNYFAEAWRSRDLLSKFVGHPIPSTDVGLAVGTAATRTQHQFHIHIECLRPEVVEALKATADKVTDRWSPLTIAGLPFQAMRLSSQALELSNPFELVANLSPDARHHMGSYTVVVAGAQYQSGPGFIILTGTGPSGDLLLDSGCIVAGGGIDN